jgi:hypothetical protein
MLAERFLVSLTEPVQLCTKIVFQANSTEGKTWTIQEISDIARNVMGDNYKAYNTSASFVDLKIKRTERKDFEHGVSRDPRRKGKFFNKGYSSNGNGSGSRGIQFKGRAQEGNKDFRGNFIEKTNRPHSATSDCFYCGKPWSHGHRCEEYRQYKAKQNLNVQATRVVKCNSNNNNEINNLNAQNDNAHNNNVNSENNGNTESSAVKPNHPVMDLEMEDVYQEIFECKHSLNNDNNKIKNKYTDQNPFHCIIPIQYPLPIRVLEFKTISE